jgi:outer membrane protein TolC
MAAAACAAGCAPADRWDVFEPAPVAEEGWRTPPEAARRLAFEPETLPRPAPVEEEGPLSLSIERATLLALENNRDLRVQRLSPVIAGTFEDLERGVFDPEVFARGEIFSEEGSEVSRATGENFATNREDTTYEAGVRQRLPTGTDVEVGVTDERSTSNRAPEQQVARVGITVTQALLQGFGPAVNLARVRQARLGATASLYELQRFIETLVAETESAYWRYTLEARRIHIFEESLELAKRQRDEVNERIEIGVLPETERAGAEAEVAQREQDLIDARAGLEVLRLRLLRLVNPDPAGRLDRAVIAVSEPDATPAPLEDLDERVRLALQRRPDLAQARVELEQERLETIVTRNGLLPRLDFFIAYGKTGYSDSFGEAFTELDGDTFDLSAGLDFTYPLGNRSARAADVAARTTRRQAAEAVANLEQLIRLDVRIAATEVERAAQQITASGATRSLREEALRAENERFRVGESTSLLVAQAQRDLLESQIAEVNAVVAYRLALIQLYLSEGSLLERRGLLLPSE